MYIYIYMWPVFLSSWSSWLGDSTFDSQELRSSVVVFPRKIVLKWLKIAVGYINPFFWVASLTHSHVLVGKNHIVHSEFMVGEFMWNHGHHGQFAQYLVGALEHFLLIFPNSWDDDSIWRSPSFFRGVGQPPTRYKFWGLGHWNLFVGRELMFPSQRDAAKKFCSPPITGRRNFRVHSTNLLFAAQQSPLLVKFGVLLLLKYIYNIHIYVYVRTCA